MAISKVRTTTFIYALTCPVSGDVRYIGKADCLSTRLKGHLVDSQKGGTHKRHWIKQLLDNGLIPKIEVLDECLIEEWGFWEQHYIDLFRSWGCDLVNIAFGGYGGKMPPDANEKRRKSLLGQIMTPERREKIAQKQRGKRASPETKTKMSLARVGKKRPHSMHGGANPRALKVRQLKLDGTPVKTWDCAKQATEFYRIRRGSISLVCRGMLESAAGYKWQFCI